MRIFSMQYRRFPVLRALLTLLILIAVSQAQMVVWPPRGAEFFPTTVPLPAIGPPIGIYGDNPSIVWASKTEIPFGGVRPRLEITVSFPDAEAARFGLWPPPVWDKTEVYFGIVPSIQIAVCPTLFTAYGSLPCLVDPVLKIELYPQDWVRGLTSWDAWPGGATPWIGPWTARGLDIYVLEAYVVHWSGGTPVMGIIASDVWLQI